jgi:hypothetical protein
MSPPSPWPVSTARSAVVEKASTAARAAAAARRQQASQSVPGGNPTGVS